MKKVRISIGIAAAMLAVSFNFYYAYNGYGIGKSGLVQAYASDTGGKGGDTDNTCTGGTDEYGNTRECYKSEQIEHDISTCIVYVSKFYYSSEKAIAELLRREAEAAGIDFDLTKTDEYYLRNGASLNYELRSLKSDEVSPKKPLGDGDIWVQKTESNPSTITIVSCVYNNSSSNACAPYKHEWCRGLAGEGS